MRRPGFGEGKFPEKTPRHHYMEGYRDALNRPVPSRRYVLWVTVALTIFLAGVIAGLGYATYMTLNPPPMMPIGVQLWL